MGTEDSLPFGARLKIHRKAGNISQEALGRKAGFSAVYISMLERGARSPAPTTITLLANALGLGPEETSTLLAAARPPRSPRDVVTGDSGLADVGSMPAPDTDDLSPPDGPLPPHPAIQTFLIADIRGFTEFTLEHGDERAAELTRAFVALARDAVHVRDGRILNTRGDEVAAVFPSARQALRAALDLRAGCLRAPTPGASSGIHVGIGLDAGEAVALDGDYRGTALNLAARLCGAAMAGEVLASETVASLARKVEGLSYAPREPVQPKGFGEPVRIVQVLPDVPDVPDVPDTAAESGSEGSLAPPATCTTSPVPAGSRSAPHTPRVGQRLPIGDFLGALPARPIVARAAEIAQLNAILDTVVGGEGRLVLLSGDAGVGKTRLAQEVTLAARELGFLVAAGRCYEPRQGLAYFPFLEALTKVFAAAPQALRDELPQRWAEVARLLPDQRVGAPLPPTSGAAPSDPMLLFWQVNGFLAALAERHPVALLLDDLHWADTASLDLLQHLAHYTRSSRILLLGTYRESEIKRHPIEAALLDLSRDHLLERLPVVPFSQEGTRALIAATLGEEGVTDDFAALLYSRTEGNAFFTREVVRTLVERGDLFRRDGAWDLKAIEELEIPQSVRSLIGQRLARLSTESQALLREASVLSPTFAFAELQTMAGRGEVEIEDALEEAIAASLVRDANDDRYGFAHALIQRTLYQEMPTHKRRRLHRLAGEALEQLDERQRPAAVLAYHFRSAGDGARAIPYALRAGDEAEAVYAHADAERHYGVAAELAVSLGERHGEAVALEKRGRVLWLLGKEAEAQELLERAALRYRDRDDLEGELRAIALTLPIHGSRGTADEGAARVTPLIAAAEAREEPGVWPSLASAYTGLAAMYAKCGRFQEQLEAAKRAEELARAHGDDTLLVPALQWRALATANLGIEDPLPLFLALATLAERVGDKWVLSRALNNVAATFDFTGELARALPYLDRALDVAEQLGSPPEIALKLLNRAGHHHSAGDWGRAREDCLRAASIIERYGLGGASWLATYPHVLLGSLDLAEGREQEGERHLSEALALAEHVGDLVAQRHVAWILAERDLLQGHAAAAYARLEPLLDREGQQEADVERLLPLVAWAEAEMGRREAAKSTLAEALARCSAFWRVDALWVQGLLRAREQRCHEAIQSLDECLALCRKIANPYAEAKALYTYGQVVLACGEPQQARERFHAAQAICERLGEHLYRRQIERAGLAATFVDESTARAPHGVTGA